jgi:serine/threonine protein kinase
MFVGTTDYVSPEHVLGGALDARSDVYSLGCMLFQMLTGRVPYPVEFEPAKLVAHTSDPVPSVLAIAPGLPSQFEAVVTRAMAKRPDERYLSAGDLGHATLAAAERRSVTRAQTSVAKGAAAPAEATAVSPPARAASDRPLSEETTTERSQTESTVSAATQVAASATTRPAAVDPTFPSTDARVPKRARGIRPRRQDGPDARDPVAWR